MAATIRAIHENTGNGLKMFKKWPKG